ncbi:hypothetical protein HUT16_20720 [Kitasatospora sp. NA04385]|nr:hypothetical protein [Kitasatospora sp. NA04385]QKW21157.1 hypothetical protein HUT16_20720 [Kitasatospora sp. NA04385]
MLRTPLAKAAAVLLALGALVAAPAALVSTGAPAAHSTTLAGDSLGWG